MGSTQCKRAPSNEDRFQSSHIVSEVASGLRRFRPQLLNIEQTPPWYGLNPYLRRGYRPVFWRTRPYVESWAYMHNQTVNIYSHLIPAVMTMALNPLLFRYLRDRFPDVPLADRLALHAYLASSSLCLRTSALHHTFVCHSAAYSHFWARLDSVGIALQITGSLVTFIHFAFYCKPRLQIFYCSMVCFMFPVEPV